MNSYLSTLLEGLDRDGCARELIIEKFSTPGSGDKKYNIQIILMIKDWDEDEDTLGWKWN